MCVPRVTTEHATPPAYLTIRLVTMFTVGEAGECSYHRVAPVHS